MFENGQLSQPSWWLHLLVEATLTKALKVKVLLKDAPPLLSPKLLVDVADGDLPQIARAASRLARHLDKFEFKIGCKFIAGHLNKCDC